VKCYVCRQVLDVDATEGRVRSNFQLPLEPSLNGIVRQHEVDKLCRLTVFLLFLSMAETFVAWPSVIAVVFVCRFVYRAA